MRLPLAWTSMSNENKYLKITIVMLAALSMGLGFFCFTLGSKDPLLIERACATSVVNFAKSKATDEEVKAFVLESLMARFNSSGTANFHLLSVNELKRRNKEQKSLVKQGVEQKIIVSENDFEFVDGKALVKADRLIRLGNLRTAFLLTLSLDIANTERTRLNPYGLILSKVKLMKNNEEK